MKNIVFILLLLLFLMSCDNTKLNTDLKIIMKNNSPIIYNESYDILEENDLFGYIWVSPYFELNNIKDICFFNNYDECYYNSGTKHDTLRYEFYISNDEVRNEFATALNKVKSYVPKTSNIEFTCKISNNKIYVTNNGAGFTFKLDEKLSDNNKVIHLLSLFDCTYSKNAIDYYNFLSIAILALENDKILLISKTFDEALDSSSSKLIYNKTIIDYKEKTDYIKSDKRSMYDISLINGYIYGFRNNYNEDSFLVCLNGGESLD